MGALRGSRAIWLTAAAAAGILVCLLAISVPVHAKGKKKRADLVVKSVDSSDSTEVGADFEVRALVKNVGKGKAAKSSLGYAFSLDRKPGGDIEFYDSTSVKALQPKKGARRTTQTVVPAIEANDYFLIVCADSEDKIKEKSEANNCRTAENKVSVEEIPDQRG